MKALPRPLGHNETVESLFDPPGPDATEATGASEATEATGASDGKRAEMRQQPPQPPLAVRMRPASLAEIVGQEHLLHEDSALALALRQGHLHSMILHGPPGSGKTTLARVIAQASEAAFEELSAVQAGRAEVRDVLARARERRRNGRASILFLDEIHRFNKAQQDALLPAVEEGLTTLIGATTENPAFEVNRALLSRVMVYELLELTDEQIATLLRRALGRGQCGAAHVSDEAIELLASRAGGDARVALNALELACALGEREVDLAVAERALARSVVHYDKAADAHYDTISAWIKATRGSDPDASLYYLAVMLEAGEDPAFIARRMVILASEDVGNADPAALPLATAAAAAVDRLGVPECQFALAQAAIYLSLAPKSDAAKRAIGEARGHVREHGAYPPPVALRSGGRGTGYDNPHDHDGHISPQALLPDGVGSQQFYRPDGAERNLAQRAQQLRRAREPAR